MDERSSIFISYSRTDKKWKDRLVKHLQVAAQRGSLTIWDDSQIAGGLDWKAEIEKAMALCGVAVLLISADFLTSDFVLGAEIPRLLERRRKEGLHVVPVLMRPCDWGAVDWLASMQIYPSGRAISKGSKHDIEEDMAALATEIRSLLNPKPAPPAPKPISPPAPAPPLARAARAPEIAQYIVQEALPKRPAIKSIKSKSLSPTAARGRFLEGVWNSEDGAVFCVRIQGPELRCVYSYKGQIRTGELYDWRISDDDVLARFRWFKSSIAGWMHLMLESRDRLAGGWWYNKDARGEVDPKLVPEYSKAPIVLTRAASSQFPQWAEEYFEKRMWEQA